METKDIVLIAVTLLILAEVSYLLAKLPTTTLKAKDRAILIDTSVLMDGRITSIAATGFMGGTLVIPRSVVGELQFLADNADADKRARARKGLDLVSELQQMDGVEVELLQDGTKASEGVDDRLLTLAKRHHAVICTLDYNLNKVAVVEGIKVLNINELAQSLRMAHLPGEELTVDLVQKGQDSHQGVGYLADGTMVVVEQANTLIGQAVRVEVTRSLQTSAGKMMFARRLGNSPAKLPPNPKQSGSAQVSKAQKLQTPRETTRQISAPRNKRSQTQRADRADKQRLHTSRKLVDREAALIDLVDKQD